MSASSDQPSSDHPSSFHSTTQDNKTPRKSLAQLISKFESNNTVGDGSPQQLSSAYPSSSCQLRKSTASISSRKTLDGTFPQRKRFETISASSASNLLCSPSTRPSRAQSVTSLDSISTSLKPPAIDKLFKTSRVPVLERRRQFEDTLPDSTSTAALDPYHVPPLSISKTSASVKESGPKPGVQDRAVTPPSPAQIINESTILPVVHWIPAVEGEPRPSIVSKDSNLLQEDHPNRHPTPAFVGALTSTRFPPLYLRNYKDAATNVCEDDLLHFSRTSQAHNKAGFSHMPPKWQHANKSATGLETWGIALRKGSSGFEPPNSFGAKARCKPPGCATSHHSAVDRPFKEDTDHSPLRSPKLYAMESPDSPHLHACSEDIGCMGMCHSRDRQRNATPVAASLQSRISSLQSVLSDRPFAVQSSI
ncbi:hypothetical protein B0I35DRAFT_480453 [Stachybotrys elegans]|uniref:Uncharacterized protein n=1 Tax=Stachybotrys elegans TaxID=80388 RepID=A0A8K0SP43_9HYPO|nr:hypothetical protein B0I35DRAFT_480453 [Stachybotrys elegans]